MGMMVPAHVYVDVCVLWYSVFVALAQPPGLSTSLFVFFLLPLSQAACPPCVCACACVLCTRMCVACTFVAHTHMHSTHVPLCANQQSCCPVDMRCVSAHTPSRAANCEASALHGSFCKCALRYECFILHVAG